MEKELYQTAKPYQDAWIAYRNARSYWEDLCESMGISENLIEEMALAVDRHALQDALHGKVSYTEEPFGD